ncbi:MAG: hypothetical protein WCF09_06320, partial [Gallionella sp.]
AKRRPADQDGAVTGKLGRAAQVAGCERLAHPELVVINRPAIAGLLISPNKNAGICSLDKRSGTTEIANRESLGKNVEISP